MTSLKRFHKILNLTSLCVMGRIIIVDIKPDIIPTITDCKYDNDDIQGNIYEKMMKISINSHYELNTHNELKKNKPIKRHAIWFD